MRVEVVNTYGEFLFLENQWNDLLKKSSSNHVFSTFEWLKAWIRAFGADKQLYILVIKEEDNIIGIAPLMISPKKYFGLTYKLLTFIYNDNSSHADFIFEKGKENTGLTEVFRYLKENKKDWDKIYLENMLDESANCNIIKNITGSNGTYLCAEKQGLTSPYLSTQNGWDNFISSQPRKFKKNLNYLNNKISGNKSLEVEFTKKQKIDANTFNSIVEISRNSWKGRIKRHIDHSPENKKFFENLNEYSEYKDWGYLWMVKLDKKPIAYEFGLLYENKFYALRADYDEKFKHIAPGAIINTYLMKYCFEQKLSEMDFCGNNEEYKLKWTKTLRHHNKYAIYKKDILGSLLYMADYKFAYPAIKFLKKFKTIRKIKKALQCIL